MNQISEPEIERVGGGDNWAEIPAQSTPDVVLKGGSKTRLLSLQDIDRRTAAYRKTADLIDAIENDLGGPDQLSTGERQIIQRAALTGALLEDLEARWLAGQPIDPAAYCTVLNAQRRLFEAVGLKRRPRDVTPDLRTYLAQPNHEAEQL